MISGNAAMIGFTCQGFVYCFSIQKNVLLFSLFFLMQLFIVSTTNKILFITFPVLKLELIKTGNYARNVFSPIVEQIF